MGRCYTNETVQKFNMDKLDEIFVLQKELNSIIIDRGDKDLTTEKQIQRLTLAMISELSELIDEVNFKWWKNPKPVDSGALKGEIVDVFHFFVCMCIAADLNPSELFALYKEKNSENIARQLGKSQKSGYKPID